MNTKEKNKLHHDFLNSIVIITSISKSASTFIDLISDNTKTIPNKQMKLFKESMVSVQTEIINITNFFNQLIKE